MQKQPSVKTPKALKVKPAPPANEAPDAPLHVAAAFKALRAGEASGHQQQLALNWLILEACGKKHSPFHGEQTHDTAFALGRQFPADLIVGLFSADLSTLRRADHVEATSRSS